MRGLVACLSGGICSITAAVMVRDLGFKLCTGVYIHSGEPSDAENLVFAKQQAEYLTIPLKEITVSGLEYIGASALLITSLAVQDYENFTITGVVLGCSSRGLFDPLHSEELARWKLIQQRLTNTCSLYVHGPCNIHLPLLEMDEAAIMAKALTLGIEKLGMEIS